MKIFVINLARRPERMAFMERQFASLGLSFERVEAIDGESMPDDERDKAVNGV